METFQTVAIGLLALSNLFLLGLVVLLAREVGIILTRLGPTGAKAMADLAPIGLEVDDFDMRDVSGSLVRVAASDRALLVFMSSSCPVCADLLPGLVALSSSPPRPVQIIVVACGDKEVGSPDYWRTFSRARLPLTNAPEVCARFGVQGWPYAFLLEGGVVSSKGIVNNLQQLEGLFSTFEYVPSNDQEEDQIPEEEASAQLLQGEVSRT